MLKFQKLKKCAREIEPHEIFLDYLSKKKNEEVGLSEKKLEVPLSKRVLQLFYFISLVLIIILFSQTFQLQIVQGEDFFKKSEANRFIVNLVKAERGVIYDKDLNQLVFNKPAFSLYCYQKNLPEDEKEKEEILKEISIIINKDFNEFKEKINKTDVSPIPIIENLDYQSLIILEARKKEFIGFEIEKTEIREYQDGSSFSHLIGYFRKTGEKTGLEFSYDDFLTEKTGKIKEKRDAQGNLLSEEVDSFPEDGNSLVLWLDCELQKKIQEELIKTMESVSANKGAAVALDAKTGGVLALVSIPSFDNNLFSQGMTAEQWQSINEHPDYPLFNRAISGLGYPTGSVIKPLIGLAALEEEIINSKTILDCPLEICIQNPWLPEEQSCYADWKYHGPSNLKRAIAESVNTFFYQVGGGYEKFKGLGATKIKEWLAKFNWGSKTNIDLPKEGQGFLPDLEKEWRLGDTYHLSIGQGPFAITPLQVAVAYAAIANGGKIYQPQVVQKIIDVNKNIIEEKAPNLLSEIPTDSENLEVVRQGMKQAVTSPQGSSNLLNSLPVSSAAKTGTAQTGEKEHYHNWISVFAPYEDPEIVLVIVIDDVEEKMAVAIPPAEQILNWYFSR